MKKRIINILEWIFCIVIAVVIAYAIKYYVGTPTEVRQSSMYPTLQQNQKLILNRLPRTFKKLPQRGQIITFQAPSSYYISPDQVDLSNPIAKYEAEPVGLINKFFYYIMEISKISYIKRVIGLPGEHIEIKDGKVYINEKELEEPYLVEGIQTDSKERAYLNITVPENCVFAIGDHRDRDEYDNANSVDSRNFGCIPLEKIEGTLAIRFWPLNYFGPVK